MRLHRIGEVTAASVVELEGPLLSAPMVFPDWSAEMVAAEPEACGPRFYDAAENKLIIAIQGFLLRTPRATILIDSCIGNDKARNTPPFNRLQEPWLDRLAAAGANPEEIDYVLCTHMHVDHVGWNTRLHNGRWVPTFPNARYIFARREWEHWELTERRAPITARSGDYFGDSVLPILEAGRADLVESDHEIESGIWLEPLPGHTPGQVGLHIKNRGGEAVFTGDMMHHPVQVARPEMSTNFDTDQKAAAMTRGRFLDRAAGRDLLVVPCHFPGATAGRVNPRKSGGFDFRFSE